jgi:hypothetical protein
LHHPCMMRWRSIRPTWVTCTVTTPIACFVTNGDDDFMRVKLNIDTSLHLDDAAKRQALDAEHVILLANPVLPHSEGEIVLTSAYPSVHQRPSFHPPELL